MVESLIISWLASLLPHKAKEGMILPPPYNYLIFITLEAISPLSVFSGSDTLYIFTRRAHARGHSALRACRALSCLIR